MTGFSFNPVELSSDGTSLVSGYWKNGLGPLAAQRGFNIASGSAFANFDGAWSGVSNGSGTATINATGGLWGGKSVTLAKSGGTYQAVKIGSQSISLQSTDVLTLVVDQVVGFANNDSVRIEMSSDNFSAKSCLLTHTLKTAHGDRVYMSFAMSDATLNGGELVSNTFNYLGVRLTAQDGASCRVLGIVKNMRARPKLVIDFDDGFASQYTEIFPYLAKYGLVANVAVIKRTVGKVAGDIDTYDYCTLAQLKEMESAGWDMITHGYYAHNTFANRAALLADVADNRDYVRANFNGRGWMHYVFPGGIVSSANDSIGVIAEAGMQSGRLVEFNPQPTHTLLGIDKPLQLWSRDLSQTTGYTAALTLIDRAIATGSTARIYGHHVKTTVADANNELSVADWKSLVDGIRDRVRDGLIDNCTMSGWAAGAL